MLRLRRNVLLAPLTTFGVGGRARWFISVLDPEQLVRVIKAARAKHLSYCVFAGGSNVVFGDGTFPGLVIHFRPDVKESPCQWQGFSLTVAANLPLERLIKTAIGRGLAGLETLSGIPGTVGGAIVGNAGAYGQTISDCLTRAEIFDGQKIKWLTKNQCQFTYRDSIFKQKRKRDWLILRAEFKLMKGDKKNLLKKSREIIKIRSSKYNPALRCPGSFFKNVLAKDMSRITLAKIDKQKIINGKIPAGYLLEQVGANGMKFGGLRVADYHGNLLINTGRATGRDVLTLAAKLKKLVKDRFGIVLDEEVRYLGAS